MDLEARGISCDAHSAVDKKLLSLPRPEREFGQKDSRDGHTWGTRGFCQGQRVVAGGRVQEGGCRREGAGGMERAAARSHLLTLQGGQRDTHGEHPTPSPPSLKGASQRRCLKQLLSRKEDI